MINNKSIFISFLVTSQICLPACVPTEPNNSQVLSDTVDSLSEDTHETDCLRTQYWFCPPHNAIWQKPVVVDTCVDPPQIISIGECVELFECDPTIFLQGEESCTTLEGFPGKKKKYCNKGQFQYGDCTSPCSEEICDGIDNDCDGQVDEGQTNACGTCGTPPSESCDGADNDCNGQVDEDLVRECSTLCGIGVEYCEEGNWISCSAPYPLEEICDGLDNDCDGQVDEDLNCNCTVNDVGTLFPCSDPPLLCGEGYKTCTCVDDDCTDLSVTPCAAICHYFPTDKECDPQIGQTIEDESCNNFDDNCNQLIDEDLVSSCYTGKEETLNVGICIAGEVYCNKGVWGNDKNGVFQPNLCSGEVLPADEDNCNGADDTCDGVIDGGKELQDTDILFIVDWSGSMDSEITAVSQALGLFAENYSDEEVILWGFIKGPIMKLSSEELLLVTDFVPFPEFSTEIGVPVNGTEAGSKEMLGDALYLVLHDISSTPSSPDKYKFKWKGSVSSTPDIQDFSVSWREDSNKVIIIFTDEILQTFMDPPAYLQNILDTAAGVNNLKIYVFTTLVLDAKTSWEKVATETGGKWFKLTYKVLPMYYNLIDILDDNICE
jgi:hypothetical protein